jgi:hypothetical protein
MNSLTLSTPIPGSLRDALALRKLLPTDTLILTHRRHTTPGGRVSVELFGVGGERLPSKAVAFVTGLGHDARRDAVIVRPEDTGDDDTLRAETLIVERLLDAIGEPGHRLGHRRAGWMAFGPNGMRAHA